MATETIPKPWGRSDRLHLDDTLQVERIHVLEGGYSSIHLHEDKYNSFVVQSGKLGVYVFGSDNFMVEYRCLVEGESMTVGPFVRHQFNCHEEAKAYEFYWPAAKQRVRADDIKRFTTNGRLCSSNGNEQLIADNEDAYRGDHDQLLITDKRRERRELCCQCNNPLNSSSPGWHLVFTQGALRMMCSPCQRETLTEIRATAVPPGVQG